MEANAEDNITLAQINISAKDRKVRWLIKACSKKNETLNSMQKMTAAPAAAMAGFLVCGRIKKAGLLFMEDLGGDAGVFKDLLNGIKNVVSARRTVSA